MDNSVGRYQFQCRPKLRQIGGHIDWQTGGSTGHKTENN